MGVTWIEARWGYGGVDYLISQDASYSRMLWTRNVGRERIGKLG